MLAARAPRTTFLGVSLVALLAVLVPMHGAGAAAGPGEPAEPATPVPPGAVELTEMRTETSKTYRLPSGQLLARLSAAPLHHRGPDGLWHDIDTTLVPVAGGGLVNHQNSLQTAFAPDGTVTVARGDARAVWKPMSLSLRDETGRALAAVAPRAGAPAVDGSELRIAGLFPGATDVHRVERGLVKHDLVLDRAPFAARADAAALTLDGLLTLSPGLRVMADGAERTASFSTTGAIRFLNADGSPAFTMRAPLVHDASWPGNPDGAVAGEYQVRFTPVGLRVLVAVPTAWLDAPARAWPVTIDPTWGYDYVEDPIMVTEGEGSQDPEDYILLGDWGTRNRGFARQILSPIDDRVVSIDTAQSWFNVYHADFENTIVTTFVPTDSWNRTTITWANQPAGGADVGSDTVFAGALGYHLTYLDVASVAAQVNGLHVDAFNGDDVYSYRWRSTTEGFGGFTAIGIYRSGTLAPDWWVAYTIDSIAPATALAQTSVSSYNGWHKGDVQVTLSCSDTGGAGCHTTRYRLDGGVWNAYGGPFTITKRGTTLVEYQSMDKVQNWETLQAQTVRIDNEPPFTSLVRSSAPAASGWHTTPTSVSLPAIDNHSSVEATLYRADGGVWQTYASPLALPEGTTSLDYRSRDVAGNNETTRSATLKVDTVPPATIAALSGTAGDAGWYRGAVTVTLSRSDATSGVAATYYRVNGGAAQTYTAPFTISSQGVTRVDYWSVDAAGNSEPTNSTWIPIDGVVPTAHLAASCPLPGNPGWCRASSFTYRLFGNDTQPPAQVLYHQTFDAPVGSEWSTTTRTTLPSGDTILGELPAAGTVTLNLGSLPAHEHLTLELDLLTMRSWDGNGNNCCGPDTWRLETGDGLVLLDTTFSNTLNSQCFPEWCPASYAAKTGAVGVNVALMGTTHGEAAYRIAVSFPHNASTLQLRFVSMGGAVGDESWGLDNIRIMHGASGVDGLDYACALDGSSTACWRSVATQGAHAIEAQVQDVAGNAASAALNLGLDNVVPSSTNATSGTLGTNGWYRSAVTVTLAATDAASGVQRIEYQYGGGSITTYTSPIQTVVQGTSTIKHRGIDVAGNVEPFETLTFKIDSLVPTTSINVSGTLGNNGWYTSQPTITLGATDATSGVAATRYRINGGATQTYTAPFVLSGSGTRTIEYWSVDNAGNTELAKSTSVKVDATPPSTTAALTGTAGAPGWYRSNVSVTLSATDADSGVAATYYSLDGGTVTAYAGAFEVTKQGVTSVDFWSEDAAGNVEAVKTVHVGVDTQAPTASFASACALPGNSGWCRAGSMGYRLFANDTVVPAAQVRYVSTFDSPVGAEWSNTTRTTFATGDTVLGPFAIGQTVSLTRSIPAHQHLTLEADVILLGSWDGSGNYCCGPDRFRLTTDDGTVLFDSTFSNVQQNNQCYPSACPATFAFRSGAIGINPLNGAGGFHGEAAYRITVSFPHNASSIVLNFGAIGADIPDETWALDNVRLFHGASGVDGPTYSCERAGTAAPCWGRVAGAGVHALGGAAEDLAGNAVTASATLRLDNIAPTSTNTTTGTLGTNGWFRSPVTLALAGSDAHSGIDRLEHEDANGTLSTYTGPIQLDAQGTTTLKRRAVDVAGNVESFTTLTIKIDTVAPATSADVTGTAGQNGWWRGPATVALAATDATSGVAATRYRIDGGATQTYAAPFVLEGDGLRTIEYWSVDMAGNAETTRTLTLKLDTVAPATVATLSGTQGAGGWYRGAVTVALAGSDATSGVDATYYRINGGATTTYAAPFTISAPGGTRIESWSTDAAGNVETARATTVRIDATAPSLATSSACSFPGNAGWCRAGPLPYDTLARDVGTVAYETDFSSAPGPEWSTTARSTTPVGGDLFLGQFLAQNVTLSLTDLPAHGVLTVEFDIYAIESWDGWEDYFDVYVDDTRLMRTTFDTILSRTQCYPADCASGPGSNPGRTGAYAINRQGYPTHGSSEYRLSVSLPHNATTALIAFHGRPNGASVADEAWGIDDVRVLLDASGVARAEPRCSLDGVFARCGGSLTSDGSRVLAATGNDTAGNTGFSNLTLRLDATPPSVWLNLSCSGESTWCNQSVSGAAAAADGTSGVASLACAAGPTALDCGAISWSVEGTAHFWANATDVAGHANTATRVVRLDLTPPTTAAALNGTLGSSGWYTSPVLVTLSATDATSGVSATRYRLDGGATQTYSGAFTIGAQGSTVLEFWSVDAAGNVEAAQTLTIRVDTLAPTSTAALSGTAGDAGWYRSAVGVALGANDAGSGVAATYWRLDGGSATLYTGPFSVAAEGTSTLEHWAVDAAGNVEPTRSLTLRIDSAAPLAQLGVACDAPGDAGWCRASLARIAVNASDATSGLAAVTCSVDGGAEGGCGLVGRGAAIVGATASPRWAAPGVWHGDAIYTFGGLPLTSEIRRHDPRTNVSTVVGHLPSARNSAAAVTDGTYAYVIGGSASGTPLPDVLRFDFATGALTPLATLPQGIFSAGAVFLDGHVYTFGGNLNLDVIYRVNVTTGAVAQMTARLPTGMDAMGAATDGTDIYLFGGSAWSVDQRPILRYTPGGASVTQVALLPETRRFPGVAYVDGTFHVVAGHGNNQLRTNLVTFHAPTGNVTSTPGFLPVGVEFPAAAWSGSDLVLVGGNAASGVVATVQRASFSPEGAHPVTLRVRDVAGNEAGDAGVVGLDSRAPAIALAPSCELPGQDRWCLGGLAVAVTPSDPVPGSGLADPLAECLLDGSGLGRCASVPLTTDGEHDVTGVAWDVAGNRGSRSVTVFLDTQPPTLDVAAACLAAGAIHGAWCGSAWGVSVGATDQASGVALLECRVDGVLVPCASFDVAAEGLHEVVAHAIDAAGHHAWANLTLGVDTTPPDILTPVACDVPGLDGWCRGSARVEPDVSDAGAGVANVSCALDGDSRACGDLASSADGTHVASIAAADHVGNAGTANQTFRIDQTAPTTSLDAQGDAGRGWWYRSPINFTLLAADATSGVAATYYSLDGGPAQTYAAGAPVHVAAEGTHTISWWSVDHAGNVETAHAQDFGIDYTRPTQSHRFVSGTQGLSPWWTSDVVVEIDAFDNLSGIDRTHVLTDDGAFDYAGPITLSGDGLHAITYESWDNALNPTLAATAIEVRIDTTPPVSTHALEGALGDNGWFVEAPRLTITASDATSGVAGTNFTVDGGAPRAAASGAATAIPEQGARQVASWATDRAGLAEVPHEIVVKVDRTAPVAVATPLCASAGTDGWCIGELHVETNASDAHSGVVAELCALDGLDVACGLVPIIGDGVRDFRYVAIDAAGHRAYANLTLKLDRTAPVLEVAIACAGNESASWCSDNATFSLASTDATSGVASEECLLDGAPADCAGSTASAHGLHVFEAEVFDAAGNRATATTTYGIDRLAPALDLAVTCPQPGSNGWCASSSFHWTTTASDPDSGLAAGEPTCRLDGAAVACDGAAGPAGIYALDASAADAVGNLATDGETVLLDPNPPHTTPTWNGTRGLAGWWVSHVMASLFATDDVSGVDATQYALDGGDWLPYVTAVPLTAEGLTTFSYASVDVAGNAETAGHEEVRIDTVAPSASLALSGPEGAGGWHVGPVRVTLAAADATSGVATQRVRVDGGAWTDYAGEFVVDSDGEHLVEALVTDAAGNNATTSIPFRIDQVDPTVAIAAPCALPGDDGWCRAAAVDYNMTASDAMPGSGLTPASPACTVDASAAPCAGTVSGEGAHALAVSAEDIAGRASTLAHALHLDSVAPESAIALSGAMGKNGWHVGHVTVNLTATDATSGVRSIAYEHAQEGASSSATYAGDFVATSEGNHTVSATARDVAGNVEPEPSAASFRIDTAAPTCSIAYTGTPGDSGWYAATGSIVVLSDDASPGSGVALVRYAIDGGAPLAYASPVPFAEEGVHTVQCFVEDVAGNEANATATLHIDTRVPLVDVSASCVGGLTGAWCSGDGWDYGFDWSDPEPGSGIRATYPHCFDNGSSAACSGRTTSEGVHLLHATVKDVAGHVSEANLTVRIDRTAPDVALELACAAVQVNGWCPGAVTVSPVYSDAVSAIASTSCGLDAATRSCAAPFVVPWQGNHTVFLNATDLANNTARTNATFRVDALAPGIRFPPVDCARPGAPGWCRAPSFAFDFRAAANDSMSGLDGAPTCRVDGGEPGECVGVVSGDGIHTIHLTQRDRAGNVATALLTVGIDSKPPTLLSVAPARAGELTIAWQAPENGDFLAETGYAVYRAANESAPFQLVATLGPDDYYVDSGLPPARTYAYRVAAVSEAGESPPSNVLNATTLGTPSAPRNVRATSQGTNVNLSWFPPADDGGSPVTSYRVFRGPRSGQTNFHTELPASRTWLVEPYANSEGEQTGSVYYRVVAVNAAGSGTSSNETQYAPTPVAPPPPPEETSAPSAQRPRAETVSSAGEFQRDWSNRSDARSVVDRVVDSIVHPSGEVVFHVGTTYGAGGADYQVVAADALNGTILWRARIDTGGYDIPSAITVDSFGRRVYVTGFGNGDALTAALWTTNGTVAWTQRYDGPAGYGDRGVALQTDHAAETLVVAATSGGIDPRTSRASGDIATLAYDADDGRPVWTRRLALPTEEIVVGMALEPSGARVHVLATSSGDFLTASYLGDGTLAWTARHDGGAADRAAGIALGPDGRRVYVTGASATPSAARDFTTISYNATSGAILWSASYDGRSLGGPSRDDVPIGIVVAPDGGTVFVGGTSAAGPNTGANLSVVAYAAGSGLRLWQAHPMEGPHDEIAHAIAISADGIRVYVAGESWDGASRSTDAIVASLDVATGLTIWSDRYVGEGDDAYHALAVSPNARVYASGLAGGPAASRFLFVAYEPVLGGADGGSEGGAGLAATLAPPPLPEPPAALPDPRRYPVPEVSIS